MLSNFAMESTKMLMAGMKQTMAIADSGMKQTMAIADSGMKQTMAIADSGMKQTMAIAEFMNPLQWATKYVHFTNNLVWKLRC
jgi:hypothetical protein